MFKFFWKMYVSSTIDEKNKAMPQAYGDTNTLRHFITPSLLLPITKMMQKTKQ